jgi:PAS domain S-box-containing protein
VIRTNATQDDQSERRRREERAGLLQELTAALSAALAPEDVGAAIIQRAMPALGANAGNVYLVGDDEGALLSIAAVGYDPGILEESRRLPLDSPTMMAEVVRAGEPILLGSWSERLSRYPHHRRVHARDGDRAVAGLPLKVEGRTIGALSLAFPVDRAFDDDDRRFMATVAALCAQALERARLYEAVRRGEAQVRFVTDHAPAYLAHSDADGRYLFVNRAFAERLGLTPEEVIGKRIPDIIGEAAYEAIREHVEAALAGEEVEFEAAVPYPTIGTRYMQEAFAPDRDERGRVRGFVAVLTDATERQKAELARQLLANASALLGESLDPEATLNTVVRLAIPDFADLCLTYLFDEGEVQRVEVAHSDPAKAELVRRLVLRYPAGLDARAGLARVLRGGQPEFLPWLADFSFASDMRDDDHQGLISAIGPRSSIIVPLRSHDRVTGAMQFVMTGFTRHFVQEDLWLAEELARRCATALENSLLYRSLQESEARFRQLADAMPQIAWVLGADGATLEYLNQRWFDYTGAVVSRMTAADANEPIHPDDMPAVSDLWAEAFRAGETFQSELRLRAANGSYRWFLSRAVPVRDSSGKIVQWFGTSTDIDDTKRAAETQRFLAELGQTLAESLDPQETLRRVARLMIPALADSCVVDLIQPDGQVRRVVWAHVDPDEQRLLDQVIDQSATWRLDASNPIARTLATGEPWFVPTITDAWRKDIALSAKHLDFLRARRVRSQMTVPLRARGRILGALTCYVSETSGRQYTPDMLDLVRDMAERVALAIDNARLYTETREAEAKVRRLLDAGVIGIIVIDGDRIVEANDHFLGMVAYTRAELDSGRLLWPAMTPPDYAERDAAALAELEERGVCTPFEKEFLRRDGSRVPILIGYAELDHDPPRWICFVLDLTERKQAEEEWRAFIDATAHDLRNPLTTVLGQTQLLQRRLRRDGAVRFGDGEPRLAAVASAATRAAVLIDDLIDTAQLRAGQALDLRLAPIDLVTKATACAEEARRVGPSHAIRVETAAAPLIVLADEPRIERVIRNMLDNAIKYSPAGGDVIVRARAEDDASGQWAVLAIEDRGIGIPAADLPFVFERFHRGGNVAGRIAGSGIGLTGAQQIVAQHGGVITVQSREGEGSTFTLRLPLFSTSPST